MNSEYISLDFLYLELASPNYGLRAKSGQRSHFIPKQRNFVINKNDVFSKHSLIWQNMKKSEEIALRKMTGPSTVLRQLMWVCDKIFGDTWFRTCQNSSKLSEAMASNVRVRSKLQSNIIVNLFATLCIKTNTAKSRSGNFFDPSTFDQP